MDPFQFPVSFLQILVLNFYFLKYNILALIFFNKKIENKIDLNKNIRNVITKRIGLAKQGMIFWWVNGLKQTFSNSDFQFSGSGHGFRA